MKFSWCSGLRVRVGLRLQSRECASRSRFARCLMFPGPGKRTGRVKVCKISRPISGTEPDTRSFALFVLFFLCVFFLLSSSAVYYLFSNTLFFVAYLKYISHWVGDAVRLLRCFNKWHIYTAYYVHICVQVFVCFLFLFSIVCVFFFVCLCFFL